MKDKRFLTIGKLIKHKEIIVFSQILDTIPKTPLAFAAHIKPERMNRLLENMEYFTLDELFRLAELFEVDKDDVITVAVNQYLLDNKNKKPATKAKK